MIVIVTEMCETKCIIDHFTKGDENDERVNKLWKLVLNCHCKNKLEF